MLHLLQPERILPQSNPYGTMKIQSLSMSACLISGRSYVLAFKIISLDGASMEHLNSVNCCLLFSQSICSSSAFGGRRVQIKRGVFKDTRATNCKKLKPINSQHVFVFCVPFLCCDIINVIALEVLLSQKTNVHIHTL